MTITPIVNSDAITWRENVMFKNNTGCALCFNLQKHGSSLHVPITQKKINNRKLILQFIFTWKTKFSFFSPYLQAGAVRELWGLGRGDVPFPEAEKRKISRKGSLLKAPAKSFSNPKLISGSVFVLI